MRVPHYAMRPLAALALIGLMAGCGGGDSTGPDAPFDPAGTTADLSAIEAAFESDAMAAFLGASEGISTALGESSAAVAVRAAPTKALVRPGAGSRDYASRLARAYVPRGMRPVHASAAILEEYLGVTFTRDPETLEYGPSELTGAPSNGVRFVVYAVNPISGEPITPLAPVGHADVVVTQSATAATIRIELVSNNVTYLDYAVGVTGNQEQITLTVAGYVSNGQDRVNFDLDTHLTESKISLDYAMSVPTRGNFRIDFEAEATGTTATSTLEARGPHGSVTISGSATSSGATFEVEVNGEEFATITVDEGGEPVITGKDGAPLTEEEQQALRDIFMVFYGGFDFFEDLLDPIGGI